MTPLPLPHRQYPLPAIVYGQHVTSTVLEFRLKLPSILDFTKILHSSWRNLPVERRLPQKRQPQILPCRKRTKLADFLCSRYEYELAFFWFDQLSVQKLPYLWMDASPCCKKSNNFQTLSFESY